jgi:hypothetical protein
MSFYKRPSKRVKSTLPDRVGKLDENSFLGRIMKKTPTEYVAPPKRPVYHQDAYLKMLERNYKEMGVPYVDPDLPTFVPIVKPPKKDEPELDVPDRVYLKLRVLKNGVVRIKLNCAIWDLHNKYYKDAKRPPFKSVLQAYKAHGFSKEYLEKIKKNQEKHQRLCIHIEKVFTKIFDKEPTKKPKKEKKKPKEMEEEIVEIKVDEDDDIVPQSDDPEEEETLDVEPDEDEEPEEEFVDDPE